LDYVQSVLQEIKPIDEHYLNRVQLHIDTLTMPQGSLGRLIELGKRYAAIKRTLQPRIEKKKIIIFAADHGVAQEGVSAYPREVTKQMVVNFLQGGAGINVLARHVGAEVGVVDIGVDCDFSDSAGLIKKKVARGTRNMAQEHAMTRRQAHKALQTGIELAREAAQSGIDLIGTGEMGIGNTTPSSAIVAAFTGLPPCRVTGRGTGVDDKGLQIKTEIIEKALLRHKPDKNDPMDVLVKVGGFEIAAIAGLVIGAAAENVPVVIDGFISTAGALVAYEMNNTVADYLFASHQSVEKGHRVTLDRMGLQPLLDLDLRLGEGTGAALAVSLVEAGVKLITEMATFEEAGVSESRQE